MIAVLIMDDGTLRGAGSFVFAAAVGAFLSGLLFAGFFGKSGRKAWLWWLAGSLLATGLGSFLGGVSFGAHMSAIDGFHSGESLVVGLLQIGGFAVLVVMLFAPSEQPLIAVLWLVLMLLVHLVARLTRWAAR